MSLDGKALEHLDELRKAASATKAEIDRVQGQRLEAILRHAHDKVPYYRETLEEAGVVRAGEVDLARLDRLPVLDKGTVRSRFADMISSDSDARRPRTNTSGGSTGEPARFIQDAATHEWKLATKLLFDSWTGFRQGERFALLWGAARDLRTGGSSHKAGVGMWLRNEMRLDAYVMSPTVMTDYIEKLNAFKPALILAYAQSAYQLADHALGLGRKLHNPRAVMTSATTLDDRMRATIEEAFGAPVYNRYGSREVGDMACDYGDGLGLVLCPLTHYIEVLGPDGKPVPTGSPGELVVTLLTNYSMPLIRYRIGDMAVSSAGSAGEISWPRLQQVLGRVTDIFYTASGTQVYGGFFTRQFYDRPWVGQFQVVQDRHDHLKVSIVPVQTLGHTEFEDQIRQLTAAFQGAMGSDCAVDFELIDTIPVGPTGKLRYTISHVGPPT